MKILVENFGFTVKLTHLEYINEEFSIEVVQLTEKYIVRVEHSARFNPPAIYYRLFENAYEIMEYVETVFEDYGVERLTV